MRYFVFIFVLLFCVKTLARDMMDRRVYGDEAPTRIYLFTSLVCPHCAQFHQDILPEIQKKYLDTHKSQLIIVDMLMNKPNLMGAMLLRCVSDEKAKKIETTLYDNQKIWALDENKARSYLSEVALRNDISAGEVETCLANKELAETIVTDQGRMSKLYDVKYMPTLVVRQGDKAASWSGSDKNMVMTGLSEFFK